MDMTKETKKIFAGIDGEGITINGKHHYILICAANEEKTINSIEDKNGLKTKHILEWLISLPHQYTYVGFAFQYDITKILEDIDNKNLFYLSRPELRKCLSSTGYYTINPIRWGGFRINFVNNKFTVRAYRNKTNKHITILDIFKFYQCKFTTALKEWKIDNTESINKIQNMKDIRSEFALEQFDEIKHYCISECINLAKLAKKLEVALTESGCPISKWYGPGSIAEKIMQSNNILQYNSTKEQWPKKMYLPIISAFFGGRFEVSKIGIIQGPIFEYDISSAYPYQTYFLPCLKCGTWLLTKNEKRILNSKAALIQYHLEKSKNHTSWGPFPYRNKNGSVCFPIESPGGWIWKDEYIIGKRLFENVEFVQAWIYESNCKHKPFEFISKYYIERNKLGKSGPGIVLKLGTNSVYGKLAQTVGSAKYNNWIWAGIITSGTRAKLLELYSLHKNKSSLIIMATDGIYSKEEINLPTPIDTKTGPCYLKDENKNSINKPLGGWEKTIHKDGIFIIRSGVYFPKKINDEQLKKIKARGVGKRELFSNIENIEQKFIENGPQTIVVCGLTRFNGWKLGVGVRRLKFKTDEGTQQCEIFIRRDYYGTWTNKEFHISYSPEPKRCSINKDYSLSLKIIEGNKLSRPYHKALGINTEQDILLDFHKTEMEDQL